MATNVTLPALGESVTEGTVTQWLKSVGDTVAVDEPLLEISTDKVDTEIPSPVAGTLLEIKAEEDETVEVGAVLAVIGEEGESPSSDDGSNDEAGADAQPADEDEAEQESEEAADSVDEDHGGDDDQPGPKAVAEPASGNTEGTAVTLPALGESVTEGTVTQWLKSVGDEVAVDEPLLEISTDKVDTEIPSPVAGTLLEIKVDEDETVEVGAELAIIGSGDAPSGDSGSSDTESAPQPQPEETQPEETQPEETQSEETQPEQVRAQGPPAWVPRRVPRAPTNRKAQRPRRLQHR